MLVGNGIRLNSGPFRTLGVTAPVYSAKMMPNYGARKNFFAGQHADIVTRRSGSQPSGVGHPYAWFWAIKPGGLASRNLCEGEGTATGEVKIIATLSGDAVGDCTLFGDAQLFAAVSGDASGSCTITGNATGYISVSGDVDVMGESLTFPTADENATAVWAKIIEAGYSAEEVVKLLAAVHLGTSSGFPTSPVFKGLDTSTNRVTGTVDTNGNRTAVTLNP